MLPYPRLRARKASVDAPPGPRPGLARRVFFFLARLPALVFDSPARARRMQFPPIPDDDGQADREFPSTLAEWEALDAPALASYRAILTDEVLVDVHDSFLAEVVGAELPYVVVQTRRCLPTHILEFLFGRLCRLTDDVAAREPPFDLAYSLAPAALARADDAVRVGIGAPPSPAEEGGASSARALLSVDAFCDAVRSLPVQVEVSEDDLIPLEQPPGPRPPRPTPARWMAMSPLAAWADARGSLAPLGDVALLLGPRLTAAQRHDQHARFRRVAESLRAWAVGGALGVLGDPRSRSCTRTACARSTRALVLPTRRSAKPSLRRASALSSGARRPSASCLRRQRPLRPSSWPRPRSRRCCRIARLAR